MKKNNQDNPIVVEQTFNASREVVWNTITNLDHMKQWFFKNIPAFEPQVGFQTSFEVLSDDRNFTHLWNIIEVIPLTMIRYHWSYLEYDGVAFVTFELYSKDTSTILRLTNEGLETFPITIPEFKRENCESGWKFFINKNLNDYLKGGF